jgi:Cu-Zn family superoxide dismutase
MSRLSFVAVAAVLAGCVPMAPPDVVLANVPLVRSDGASIGSVRVFQENTGVMLRIDASGFPAGLHGVHLHSVGRCEGPKFTSAGGHWNPTGKKHGHRNPEGFHSGDLGNLGVGADGKLVAGLLVPEATVAGLHDSDGTALVMHAQADDEMTDPSGNSGERIACAVL